MTLSSIFAKPVNRPIEGVIKADDEASLRLEVEEYVLTNEVAKRLEEFLSAYHNYRNANGVWISGFFGSGKSHLLKMLALLLENRIVEGAPVLDLFLPKCGDNEFLRGELKRLAAAPSKSILFNIDQKAEVISKSQTDALLAVFAKVFDEMCGYYGKQGYIAQFERDLDSRGLYEQFKQCYEAVAKQPWTQGREQVLLEGHNIAAAYAQATGQPEENARGILDKYRADYKLSIEDFADQVNRYIEAQGPTFRLNFFVDEAGQYIADNVKLMTNLQTVAESLATKCRGRAWIVVTAQEDMNTVVGEMGKHQSNDFSKIQARFATRMKLTSQNVDEVIRKRLLLKNERGVNLLSTVYDQQKNNFKTLFDFADGSITYRNFQDCDEFIDSYPFIPYQFPLFQSAIQNLSLHNAFEGKHSSVGERSMLGVFQDVVIRIADNELGRLATFDLMFEGIRTTLKSQIQRSILLAEEHLNNPFALKLLKALFLVKYVKAFKATQRNLTILMMEGFDRDLPALRKRVEEALNLLEEQTYIQRNGEVYEYLTDEEKDVEEEIKHTEVESTAVADELATIIFDSIIKQRKIRHTDNQDYPFARKLDDRLLGREYELAIHVISPFHEHAENEEILRAQAMGRDELLVIMPATVRLLRDLTLYKQTEKYIRQSTSVALQDSIKRIIAEKGTQNSERLAALRKLVEEKLLEAKLIVAGQEVDAASTDAQTRIIKGFQDLIVRTYPNLAMLRGVTYSEQDIAGFLQPSATLLGDDATTLSEAEMEILGFLQRNKESGLRTTVLSLVNHFERKPYGWYLAAIQCILAKVIGRGKVDVRLDSNVLEGQELLRVLRNSQGHTNLLLEPRTVYSPGQLRKLREFYADFFDGPPLANEAKALAQETAISLQELLDELTGLRQREATHYPFLIALDDPLYQLNQVVGRPYSFYYEELPRQQEALLDLKEQIISPIRSFMSGELRKIYNEARDFLRSQDPNFTHAASDEARQLQELLASPTCYVGNHMTQVKSLLDVARAQVNERVQEEQNSATAKVQARWERLAGMDEFAKLTPEQQAQLRQPFDELTRTLAAETLIAVIRDKLNGFENGDYQAILRQMSDWVTPIATPNVTKPGSSNGNGAGSTVTPPRVAVVPYQSLQVDFDKAWLTDEDDVDRYLAALKDVIMREIQQQKRVQV